LKNKWISKNKFSNTPANPFTPGLKVKLKKNIASGSPPQKYTLENAYSRK
jgi:hypothetical protein